MTSLPQFLQSHRVAKGDPEYNSWNITGITRGPHGDMGCYKVDDEEYETFITLVHSHIFGVPSRVSSLLERHREVGPILVDLDFRYENGGPLVRRFTSTHGSNFIAEYVAAMIYFSKVENLTHDLLFYELVKPAPEADAGKHKDGIHIQCPSLSTSPKYQFAIRGFLLDRDLIGRVFGDTDVANAPEDIFDNRVIKDNNWFLYGACKPDKAQYRVAKVWRIPIADVADALDGDPADYEELVEIVKEIMVDVVPVTTNTMDLMKTLSIRRGHTADTPLAIRATRSGEWEELMIAWGSGKARSNRTTTVRNTLEPDGGDELVVTTPAVIRESASTTSSSETPAYDVTFAHRLARECINAERRAGDYTDWINLAICLKNISNTEDSFKIWMEVTRRVSNDHKKSTKSEAELRSKWALIRNNGEGPRLTIRSLIHWAEEDNNDKFRSILSESITDWIVNFAKDTHVSVATCVNRLYEYEFRCSVGARRGAFEWYQYPKKAHSWRHLRTPTEIRARLSGMVKAEYLQAIIMVTRREQNATIAGTDGAGDDYFKTKRDLMGKIVNHLEMSNFKDSVMKECQEGFYDEEFLTRLNCNPFLVGVANGVLDLNYFNNDTMSGRPHVRFRDGLPDDCISFQMGRCEPDLEPIPYIPYNADTAEQKELSSFFEHIYPDPVLREYVITLLASCLEGQNKEQRFYLNQGGGSNGKSMIQILMEFTFGDYQTSLQTTVLTRKRPESGAANPDMITTKCKRYIYMGEPDVGEKLNTSRMKQLSGEDRVEARGLFSDQEKFNMMGKIFLSCNDLPPVSSMDNGTWRRIRVIPHISIFKDPGDPAIDPSKHIYEKDLHLKTKLRHWRIAFLSLLVHYYEHHYLAHGLKEPDCVVFASNKYKEENDLFTQFFTDNFVKEVGAGPITAKEVRGIFRDWKKALGRACDLKDAQILDRMKTMCGNGSNDKEFWGVRVAEEAEDISGNLLTRMP